MAFEKGNKHGKGGKRPGAGPKPEWFTQRCREIVTNPKVLDMLEAGILGQEVDQFITRDGEILPIPVKFSERVKALEFLADRGFGKAPMKVNFDAGGSILEILKRLEEERGLGPND